LSAGWLLAGGLLVFALAYRFYSRYLATRVFQLDENEPVPALERADGIDYVATPKHVLFGHHYASIAGAAPIIGPAIAVVWGWLPALLWVVLGTVFMGAVHDFSILVLSVRHGGRSVGAVVADVIGPRSRGLFLLVILFLVMLVIAVFAKAIAQLFIGMPQAVIPINFEILVAVAIGWWAHKKKGGLLVPSVLALISLYAVVWVGVRFPISLDGILGLSPSTGWAVLLLAYAYVASVLPVWVLLHPRDYINSHQLLVGLVALTAGIFWANPNVTAPVFQTGPADAPSWFPFLFVTIACGAISGFHGLVSSGTTSKQLSCATDARLIGYGGMLGEGTLALIATISVSAGLADWASHYHSFEAASSGGVGKFVEGASTFLRALGLPSEPSKVLVAILVISFAATTLDTGVRIQRYVLQELGDMIGSRPLQNRYIASAIAVCLPLALIVCGQAGPLWALFGSSNQLLAGLSLTVVTVWLYRTGKVWAVTAVPMVVVIGLSLIAMLGNLVSFLDQGNLLLATIGGVILALQGWVLWEGAAAILHLRSRA